LRPPTPDKQFLISPPASPPVGWEPVPESHPTINYNHLVSAIITKLKPGEAHEMRKPKKKNPILPLSFMFLAMNWMMHATLFVGRY